MSARQLARRRQVPYVKPERAEPALIWIDPARMGGTPCVYGHRITCEMVARYVWDDMVHDLEFGYNLPKSLILGACWYTVRFGSGRERWARAARKAWRQWADDNEMELWHSRYDAIPWPAPALEEH